MQLQCIPTTRLSQTLAVVAGILLFLLVSHQAWGKVCSKNDWCWENPLPQGDNLKDVWGTSADNVFAVGWGGTIIHYDGST